ncbi:MAG: MerR family DNA-binding transcriptional regulator [Acidimicrobiales bacterium]|nr:MerR family DNA-binding transcriptional regulator [Acidimicrobiales bacterium]
MLSLLQEEFPDVTISKIRFLESQGLLDPERTPSGYRKFYEADIDRLRWILRQQKDHYLPLKVIKDRLDETGPIRTAPTAATRAELDADAETNDGLGITNPAPAREAAMAASASGTVDTRGTQLRHSAVALDDRPGPEARRAPGAPRPVTAPSAPTPTPAVPPDPAARGPVAEPAGPGTAPGARRSDRSVPEPPRTDVADVIEAPVRRPLPTSVADPTLMLTPNPSASTSPEAPAGDRARSGGRPRPAPQPEPGAVSLTAEELSQATGLSMRSVRELEGYGLLETHMVGDAAYYDADALVIARTAAGFLEHGIEARHIRSYKVAVEREAGLFEQIVLPLLKQRNPDARRRATQTVAELMRLGDDMRSVLLRRGLRDHIPPTA